MKKDDSRLVGVLGTVIFHLLAAIIFMSFQITTQKKEIRDIYSIEFEEPPPPEPQKEEKIVLPLTALERILQDDPEMMNIAKNLANKSDPTINREDYIDMVKEELIKSGKLNEDNYIDEWREKALKGDEEIPLEQEEPEKATKEESPTEAQKMASNFKGPTRIYYSLEGRTHTYLPVPIYKCEGSGKITLAIEVSLKGVVESAHVIGSQSTTTDPCLIETAINTALLSRFNADVNAPKSQKGTLTYHFVAQ